jgi:uncharacterized GH25 family protein
MASRNSKSIVIVLALVAASLALLFVWVFGKLDSPRTDGAAAPDAQLASGDKKYRAPLAVPSSDSSADADRRTIDAGSAPEPLAAPGPSTATVTQRDATLVVRCRAKPAGAPLARIRVQVWKSGSEARPDEVALGTRGSLEHAPITGKDGVVELDLPSGIDLHLFASSEHDEAGYDDRELPALEHDEKRVLVLDLAAGEDLRFQGLVLARETRKPVAGASVLVLCDVGFDPVESSGKQFASGETSKKQSETTTDSAGRFEIRASSWKVPYLRIDAKGFGPLLVEPGANHSTTETARILLLERSATIEGSVVDASGAPVPGVTVHLIANGYDLRPKDGAAEFTSASTAKVDWSADTRGDGRCTLKDLAPNAALTVVLERDGKPVQKETEPMTLAAGETRSMKWTIGSGCAINGLVVDEKKKPVPKLEIWLVPARSSDPRYFNAYEDFQVETKATTDERGRFTFANIGAGKWWIGPGAQENPGGGIAANGVAPFARSIEIPAGKLSMDLVIEVQRGLYIRGRVIDPSESGAPGAFVVATTADGSQVSTQTNSEGEFVLGPLLGGTFQLLAHGRGATSFSDPVQAKAGDEKVILKLYLGGVIEGKVVDANGEGCRATISIAEQSGRLGLEMMGTENDGSFQWDGLEPGTYDLVARLNDGRIALSRGVSLAGGARVTGLVLALEPGAKLRAGYRGTKSPARVTIKSDGAIIADEELLENQGIICVVPRGRVTVELHLHGVVAQTRDVDLAVGEEKEIVFTDDR